MSTKVSESNWLQPYCAFQLSKWCVFPIYVETETEAFSHLSTLELISLLFVTCITDGKEMKLRFNFSPEVLLLSWVLFLIDGKMECKIRSVLAWPQQQFLPLYYHDEVEACGHELWVVSLSV